MKSTAHIIGPLLLSLPVLIGFAPLTKAQEVIIPDPGLNAAIRQALQKSSGPMTEQDLLSLNFLSACCRDSSSLQGLEAARNLSILDLHSNSLTNAVILGSLTDLKIKPDLLIMDTHFRLKFASTKLGPCAKQLSRSD